jgi:hypothetical protein
MEQQATTMQQDTQAHDDPYDRMSQDELRQFATMQVQEIERYKWCLGVRLGHDPLRDRELNAIAKEWIDNYAAGFRAEYENRRRRPRHDGPALSSAD